MTATKREILQRIRKTLWDHLEDVSGMSYPIVSAATTCQALETIVRIDRLLDDPAWIKEDAPPSHSNED